MLRSILILKLSDFVRTKLQSLGYEYVEDIEKALKNRENMTAQLKALIDENNIAEKILRGDVSFKVVSGSSLWHSEFCNPPIAVFHRGLDKLLDGGLPVGRITELCGAPGSGKTQMCLQFCVDVQIPVCFGGSAAEALYITTDFGFGSERLSEIIDASIRHCLSIEPPAKNDKANLFSTLTEKNLLRGVNVLKTYKLNDLIFAVKSLKNILKNHPKIKLLIIDSLSLPLVTQVEDVLLRSKITAEILDYLLDSAIEFKLAVVLTNQLVTILGPNNKAILKPSLGEGYGHRLHVRLLLDSNKVYLTKSIKYSQLYTTFEITKDGIR